MRNLVLLLVFCSFSYSQVRPRPYPMGSIKARPYTVPMGDAQGKLDSSWFVGVKIEGTDTTSLSKRIDTKISLADTSQSWFVTTAKTVDVVIPKIPREIPAYTGRRDEFLAADSSWGVVQSVDTSRASYWATRLRVVADSIRSAFKSDTSVSSYWATALRVAFIDTSRASYWASAIRGDYVKPSDTTTLKNSLLKNADSTSLRNYSTALYLGKTATADTSKASYWATAIRGGIPPSDSARASYWATDVRGNYVKPADTTTQRTYSTALYLGKTATADTSKSAYWSTKSRGVVDTSTAAYWATSLRGAVDTARASYWSTKSRGVVDTATASYWSTAIRGNFIDTSRASYWSSNVRGNYLKPADSTTLKNGLLKNADSTTIKNGLLKNADSTSIRNYSTALYAPKASPTFTGRWTGSTSIRGKATFTTTGVRVAVYVPGTLSTDYVVCTPTLATVVTTTNLTAFAKTDSLIFLRGASGTSGAVLNWILMR